jgi:hypothetical protein
MKIPMEDWLRGCVYHDGRHGEVTLRTDKVVEIADYIQSIRRDFIDGCIEIPPSCDTCRFREDVKAWNRRVCDNCVSGSNYNRQAETPQTDCGWGKPGDINEDGKEIEQDGDVIWD